MSDAFYKTVCFLGRPVFWICSRPVVLHRQRIEQAGGCLLVVGNHRAPYDSACLMNVVRRPIDWVSIKELMDRPLVGPLFRALNCMPLDRHQMDSVTAREILKRLRAGRLVALYPEAQFRGAENSVLNGGSFTSGFGQIAQLAKVPVIPCLLMDTGNFAGVTPWLPFRHTRYAVAFGEPLRARQDLSPKEAREDLEERWRVAVLELREELEPHLTWRREGRGAS